MVDAVVVAIVADHKDTKGPEAPAPMTTTAVMLLFAALEKFRNLPRCELERGRHTGGKEFFVEILVVIDAHKTPQFRIIGIECQIINAQYTMGELVCTGGAGNV